MTPILTNSENREWLFDSNFNKSRKPGVIVRLSFRKVKQTGTGCLTPILTNLENREWTFDSVDVRLRGCLTPILTNLENREWFFDSVSDKIRKPGVVV